MDSLTWGHQGEAQSWRVTATTASSWQQAGLESWEGPWQDVRAPRAAGTRGLPQNKVAPHCVLISE